MNWGNLIAGYLGILKEDELDPVIFDDRMGALIEDNNLSIGNLTKICGSIIKQIQEKKEDKNRYGYFIYWVVCKYCFSMKEFISYQDFVEIGLSVALKQILQKPMPSGIGGELFSMLFANEASVCGLFFGSLINIRKIKDELLYFSFGEKVIVRSRTSLKVQTIKGVLVHHTEDYVHIAVKESSRSCGFRLFAFRSNQDGLLELDPSKGSVYLEETPDKEGIVLDNDGVSFSSTEKLSNGDKDRFIVRITHEGTIQKTYES